PIWSPSVVRVYCQQAVAAATRPAGAPEPGRSAAAKKMRIAVLQLTPRAGVSADVADLFTDALVGELRKDPALQVMGTSDVRALLGLEKERQLLGCAEDESCLQEIAGGLGVDRVVNGSVGRVGSSLVVNLTVLDTRKARALASVSERLKGESDEVFFDALPRLVRELMHQARP
ncbi:MAG: hypothetical protein ACK4N5_26055, partial [Myxococcales bacterium]